jgi:FAD/FMN-containing dehydrogenase
VETLPRRLSKALADAVGIDNVVTDAEVAAGYSIDWTGRFAGWTPVVVRPRSTAEVAAVVEACREEEMALVPQGGNTGLVGGGVPLAGEVLLSLRRLADPVEVDDASGQASAGAGVTVASLRAAAEEGGAGGCWTYGVDLASRDSATVGGTIATNAGGTRFLRYGDTRAQLLGLEAVLGDGSVVSHLGGLLKDNTGYHLPGLLCGSEGTLGVVTAARLRLVPRLDCRVVALLAFASAGEAVTAATALRGSVGSLEAAELFLAGGLEVVQRVLGLPTPFAQRHEAYLLVEAAAHADPAPELVDGVESLPAVRDVAVGLDSARRSALWRYREAHTEAINSLGAPHKLDVTIPVDRLGGFVGEVPAMVAGVDPGAETWMFGHAADGNVHVNVTGVAPDDERVDEAVLLLAASYGGSISAEHGIGTAKKRFIRLGRSEAEIGAFRSIKAALDPAGIMNPNALLP